MKESISSHDADLFYSRDTQRALGYCMGTLRALQERLVIRRVLQGDSKSTCILNALRHLRIWDIRAPEGHSKNTWALEHSKDLDTWALRHIGTRPLVGHLETASNVFKCGVFMVRFSRIWTLLTLWDTESLSSLKGYYTPNQNKEYIT